MNKIILAVLFCLFSSPSYSHPGKTDRYGGHSCIKDCEEWKLYYREYHLHDKDGKPIRVAAKGKPRKKAEPVSAATEIAVVPDLPRTIQTVTVYHVVTKLEQSPFLVNPLLLVLLALFLLLLIIRMRRDREKAK